VHSLVLLVGLYSCISIHTCVMANLCDMTHSRVWHLHGDIWWYSCSGMGGGMTHAYA